ncbi:hypothetical protein GCM10023354_19680 [Garicola koreensis]
MSASIELDARLTRHLHTERRFRGEAELSEQERSDHVQQTSAAQQPPDDVGSSGPTPTAAEPPAAEETDSDSPEAPEAAAPNETAPPNNPAPPDSAPPDSANSLSDFLDTLDARARTWWATRKERKAQKAAGSAPSPAPSDEEEHPQTGPVGLPKPPPPEVRPEGQLFTGAVPGVGAQTEPEPSNSTPEPAERAAEPAASDPSADDTVVLPAYRDEPQPSNTAAASTAETDTAESNTAESETASSFPARPPRPRRALDEQRRRDVIAQKARAIEYETAAYYGQPARESADDEEDLYTYIPPYNLPSRDPDPEPTRLDLYRRIFVSIGALAAVISTAWLFGWLGADPEAVAILSGNGLHETYAEGWFSGEYALLSPDHNYYWLWPIIVVGLVAHAAFQWTGTQNSTPRQRRSGWLVGSASLLMLGVTAALYAGMLTWVLVTSLLIAMLLVDAVRQFNLHTSRSTAERRLNDGVIGLFFGFALVQAMSSVSVWLTARGWEIPGFPALLWAAAGLFICVWTAAFYSMTERGRITIALGLGWGMFWLIFPRLLTEVTSVWVAIGAAMGAFIVILCTQSRRHWINHAERRAAMGRPLEDII